MDYSKSLYLGNELNVDTIFHWHNDIILNMRQKKLNYVEALGQLQHLLKKSMEFLDDSIIILGPTQYWLYFLDNISLVLSSIADICFRLYNYKTFDDLLILSIRIKPKEIIGYQLFLDFAETLYNASMEERGLFQQNSVYEIAADNSLSFHEKIKLLKSERCRELMFGLFKTKKDTKPTYLSEYKPSERVNLPIPLKEGLLDLEVLNQVIRSLISDVSKGELTLSLGLESFDHLLEQCYYFFNINYSNYRKIPNEYWNEFLENKAFILLNKADFGFRLLHGEEPTYGFRLEDPKVYISYVMHGALLKPREIGNWKEFMQLAHNVLVRAGLAPKMHMSEIVLQNELVTLDEKLNYSSNNYNLK